LKSLETLITKYGKASLAAIVFQKLFGLRRGCRNVPKTPPKPTFRSFSIYAYMAQVPVSSALYRPLFSTGWCAMPTGGPGHRPAEKIYSGANLPGFPPKKCLFLACFSTGALRSPNSGNVLIFGLFRHFWVRTPRFGPNLALFAPFRSGAHFRRFSSFFMIFD